MMWLSNAGVKVDKVWEKRLSGVVGKQKGAAAVRLHFEEKSLLFITSHLARKSFTPLLDFMMDLLLAWTRPSWCWN